MATFVMSVTSDVWTRILMQHQRTNTNNPLVQRPKRTQGVRTRARTQSHTPAGKLPTSAFVATFVTPVTSNVFKQMLTQYARTNTNATYVQRPKLITTCALIRVRTHAHSPSCTSTTRMFTDQYVHGHVRRVRCVWCLNTIRNYNTQMQTHTINTSNILSTNASEFLHTSAHVSRPPRLWPRSSSSLRVVSQHGS